MEDNFYIVPAFYDDNTFFLFRDFGFEIKFTSINGVISIIGNGKFSNAELKYIYEFYL